MIHRLKTHIGLFSLALALTLIIAACGGNTSNNPNNPNIEITLVSFAVTKPAHQQIIPKFIKKWQQEHQQTISFKTSYGGSGTQTRAVIDGLDADIVHLALGLDIQKIQQAGLIKPTWELQFPHQSIVTQSVPVIVTRQGNPQKIQTWQDLANNNIKIITADPKTSGVARWNFLALWNALIQTTQGNESQAIALMTKIYQNAPILTKDAREASDIFFKQGQGDILINYENEIILAAQKGQTHPYIVPETNILIQNPIALVDKNVDKHGTRKVATAFIQYLYTPEAQIEFAKIGFRPVDQTITSTPEFATKYPKIKNLATVQDYGGWSKIQQKFFSDQAIFDQIQQAINHKGTP